MLDNDPQVLSEIESFFLEEFVDAFPKHDIDKHLSLFWKDENLVMFGTTNKKVGYEDYKTTPAEDKSRYDDISLVVDWHLINSHSSVGWIAAEVSVTLKLEDQQLTLPARLTVVVKKIEGKWQIVQGHISMATDS